MLQCVSPQKPRHTTEIVKCGVDRRSVFGYTVFVSIKTEKCENLAKNLLHTDKKFTIHPAEFDKALTKNDVQTSEYSMERSGVHG